MVAVPNIQTRRKLGTLPRATPLQGLGATDSWLPAFANQAAELITHSV